MKTFRVVTIGLLLSWVLLQFIYVPYTKYFLNKSYLYAFSLGLEAGNPYFHSITVSLLLITVMTLSLSVGMFVAAWIYSPIEKVSTNLIEDLFKKRKS